MRGCVEARGSVFLLFYYHLFLRLGHRQMYTFIRFKLGCHRLAIVTGRWHGVARADRLCLRCDADALDDERHLVFECSAFEICVGPTISCLAQRWRLTCANSLHIGTSVLLSCTF